MNKTNISYLTHTYNPIAMRCTPCSPGCANCWALAMADRLCKNPTFDNELRAAYAGESAPVLRERELTAPMRRKKPARIGTQFMGDLWHKDVPDAMIDAVFASMTSDLFGTTRHTYLLLTKRPGRILQGHSERFAEWPNLWLGVTVCNQAEADAKIPVLLSIAAAVRWLSIEPMLEDIDLATSMYGRHNELHWVVVGCESGPRPRPCNVEWVRSVVAQCKAASVAVYVKQLDIGGKCVEDINQFPADLRVREYPEVKK